MLTGSQCDGFHSASLIDRPWAGSQVAHKVRLFWPLYMFVATFRLGLINTTGPFGRCFFFVFFLKLTWPWEAGPEDDGDNS